MATRKTSKTTRKTRSAKPGRARGRRGLRGRCVVRFTPDLVQLGGIASSLLENLAGNRNRYVAEFLITEEQQRVTYGTGDATMTVVYRGAEGIVFWDQRTRTVADIPGDLMPRSRVAPSGSLEMSSRARGNATTFILTMRDHDVGTLRHEITISRNEEWAPFGPALLRVLHCGPMCHAESGLPWEEIAGSGLITRERAFLDGASRPTSEMTVEGLKVVPVTARDFSPPAGYQRLEKVVETMTPPPEGEMPEPGAPPPSEQQATAVRQALEGEPVGVPRALRINQKLTPDCLGSTRFGAMTATIHQDLVTIAANAVNLIAPLIGPTTIAGGTWTIPWLANLNTAGPTGPGSGIRCFLRDPRRVNLAPGTTGGGLGLVDRLAFQTLYRRDAAGLMRTQRDFVAGTLPATLASWGVLPADVAALMAVGGDLEALTTDFPAQRRITERFELTELTTFSIPSVPARVPPATAIPPYITFGDLKIGSTTTPPLFTIAITSIGGTINFASLAGPMITTATIGSSGNIVLAIALPTTTLSATVIRGVTPFGGLVLSIGTALLCAMMPVFCPLAVVLVTLAIWVLSNVTTVMATAAGVTWILDVRFEFDPATERVEPFVSVAARSGSVTVGTFASTPNIIATAVESLLASLGNLFDGWGALLAAIGSSQLQALLRSNGIQLPVASQDTLRAVGGGALSSLGGILRLEADIQPVGNIASEPYTTQVDTRPLIGQQLLKAHLDMRRGLNPQPTPPPPGPGPALTVGTFVGLGLSQNTLNYYLFAQWLDQRTRRFEVEITDPSTINDFAGAAGLLFVRRPARVHLWCAVAPRVELAPNELMKGTRPLVLFFDDVRACFQTVERTGLWELCCNFRTTATVDLAWPFLFSLRADQVRASSAPLEPRTWEFVDTNRPAIMATVTPNDLEKLVDLIAEKMLARLAQPGFGPPINPRPWTRPLPSMQQLVAPALPVAQLGVQQVYLELMGRRKAMYVLPAIDSQLLDLVDGSGSPTLNAILATLQAPGPRPTTVGTMTCGDGALLRQLIPLPPGP